MCPGTDGVVQGFARTQTEYRCKESHLGCDEEGEASESHISMR